MEGLNAANQTIDFDDLAALSGARVPNNVQVNHSDDDPLVMLMPDLLAAQNQLNSLVENSNDTGENPLDMVECLLGEQNDSEASGPAVNDRRLSIYEEWKTTDTSDQRPAQSFEENATNGGASTSAPNNLPSHSLSSVSNDSIGGSDEANATRSRRSSNFYQHSGDKKQNGERTHDPSISNDDDEPSSDREENATREQGGLSTTNFSAINLSFTNGFNRIQKQEPNTRTTRPLPDFYPSATESTFDRFNSHFYSSTTETAFDRSHPDNYESLIESVFDRSHLNNDRNNDRNSDLNGDLNRDLSSDPFESASNRFDPSNVSSATQTAIEHPSNLSTETAFDRSDPQGSDLDDLEVVYRSRPIKRENFDDELIDCTGDEPDAAELSKRFKLDSDGCIVIE